VRLLPEERALNSMYELCVLSGNYAYALQVPRDLPIRRIKTLIGCRALAMLVSQSPQFYS
jgi:hypothetical protein